MSTLTYSSLVLMGLTFASGISAAYGETVGQLPLGEVIVHVEADSRSTFLERLKVFAEHEAFAIRIAPTHPDGAHFLAQLWREDVKAIGTNSADAVTFEIFFYLNSVHELPPGMLESMMGDLRATVATPSLDGIKIIERSGS